MTAPYERAMSSLVAAIGDLERNPPVTMEEIARVEGQIKRLHAVVMKAYDWKLEE